METRRWVNPAQPQTLQFAVFLFYADAVISALLGSIFSVIGIVFIAGAVASGYGIANERRWAYVLGVVLSALAVLPFVFVLLYNGVGDVLNPNVLLAALFPVARLALLVHTQSREYQRIWFK